MRTKFVLIAIASINVFCLPVLAGLPNTKKMVFVGVGQPQTNSETKNYVDPASVQKRGSQVFYTVWAFWKYPQGPNYAAKEMHAANCQNWENTRINFAGVDAQGQLTGQYSDGKKELAVPGSIEDKSLQFVCKR